MPGISNKFTSIPRRKISRYKIWKENTVVGFIYMMASYHMKIRSVQIPINIETKNSNIAFEYLLVLHLLHSILKAAGVIEASLLYESERKEKVPQESHPPGSDCDHCLHTLLAALLDYSGNF